MSALKIGHLVLIGTLIASLTSPSEGHRSWRGQCPNEWFTAQFVTLADVVVPGESLPPIPDPEHSFFRKIMRFNDDEIDAVTNDAIEFMKTKFGLDFLQSTPDAEQRYTLGNAVFQPYFLSLDIPYTINLNSWLLTGRFQNFCFENRDGGFTVQFTEQQMLHGTYGGEDGILANPGDVLLYGFYNIAVPQRDPIIIRYQSGTPFRVEPIDGFGPINCELHHSFLGEGVAQGTYRAVQIGESNKFHLSIRNVLTFPGHPGLN